MAEALGDAGADGDWVLVAVPPAAASGVPPAANSQLPDDATAATEGPREYYTLPDYVYFRLKGTEHFLKVHGWQEMGVLPPDAVTNGRRHRTNEGHGFRIYPWKNDAAHYEWP